MSCYFGNNHSDTECCISGRVENHTLGCYNHSKCCVCKIEQFPNASALVVKPKEEFYSLDAVLSLIINAANRGDYHIKLTKPVSPIDAKFLEDKGYRVITDMRFNPGISWLPSPV